MYKSKQFSPRTYEHKRNELEVWVTKEKEDVKKTKKGVRGAVAENHIHHPINLEELRACKKVVSR